MTESQSSLTPPLATRGLRKVFSERAWTGRKRRTLALSGLDLYIQPGEAFGLIGPNGSGKSTTIKLALGLVFPNQGEVLLNGLPPTVPHSRQGLGFMPENPSLMGHLGAREHLVGAGRLRGLDGSRARQQASELLDRLGLNESGDMTLNKFSKGMAQRAALGHALMGNPNFLILDEPLTGLDPLWRKRVVDLLMDFRANGGTLLFSSHILSDVERLGDRIGILHRGRLLEITTPAELVSRHVGTYLIRTQGTESPPADLEAAPEGPGQWGIETTADRLWSALKALQDSGHRLIEVRPGGTGLEGAVMELIEDADDSGQG